MGMVRSEPEPARGLRRRAAGLLVAVGTAAALVVACLAPAAGAVSRQAPAPRKTPHGASGQLFGITAVPHSSDAWAVGENIADGYGEGFYLVHWHDGKAHAVKAPKLGGRYGSIGAIAAASPSAIWIGGGRQAVGIQELPSIYRWNGKAFVLAKLPGGLEDGAVAVTSISASSATNAWAVGPYVINAKLGEGVALQWNGKTWSESLLGSFTFTSVSTSSPTNAFAVSTNSVYHWNGTAWTQFWAPSGGDIQLQGIAASSPTDCWATGFNTNTYEPVAYHYNGKAWTEVAMAKSVPRGYVNGMSMSGNSAWIINSGTHAGHFILAAFHSSGGPFALESQPHGAYGVLVSISAESSTKALAAGYVNLDGGTYAFAESFNGHTWNALPL